ncbi:MAG TPA: DUF4372 domain-containing protein [Nitrospirae bacterium]|nr:DUF4372 domain-containing protein [Nitrospirota bacterium]
MSHSNTIFNQLLHLLPRHEFEKAAITYEADRYVKYFSCRQQFITLMYARIRKKDSLRDIITSLRAQYHNQNWWSVWRKRWKKTGT